MKIKNIAKVMGKDIHSDLTRGVNVEKLKEATDAPQAKLVPVNAHIVERAKSYKQELPDLLKNIASERDFLLTEVFPPAMAALNAFEDAGEVLASTLEGYDISAMAPLYESYAMNAVRSKILCRIISQFNMSKLEVQYFLTRILASEGHSNDRIQSILHEVQSLADMHRSAEGSKVQMRPVSGDEGDSQHRGVRVPGRNPKRGGGPVSAADELIHERLRQSRAPRGRRQQESKAPSQATRRLPRNPGL